MADSNLTGSINDLVARCTALIPTSTAKELFDISLCLKSINRTENNTVENLISTRVGNLLSSATPLEKHYISRAVYNMLETNVVVGVDLPTKTGHTNKLLETNGISTNWSKVDSTDVTGLDFSGAADGKSLGFDGTNISAVNSPFSSIETISSSANLVSGTTGQFIYAIAEDTYHYWNGSVWQEITTESIPDWNYDAADIGAWNGAGQYYTTAQNQIYKAGGMWINSDGTKLYISAQQNNGQLQVYSMSTPYLYSTLSHDYTGQTYINAYGGFDFTDDGMKIIYTKDGAHNVYYNNLNNAFDVSTRNGTHVTVTQISPGIDIVDFKFSYDGTKAFALCGDDMTNMTLRTWDLSTAYDVSTASEDTSNQINFFNKDTNNARGVSCFQFNPLGTVLYFIAEYNHKFCSYPLSTAWDVSTAGTISDDGPHGVSDLFRFTTRKDDGSTVFLMGDANYNVARIYHRTL